MKNFYLRHYLWVPTATTTKEQIDRQTDGETDKQTTIKCYLTQNHHIVYQYHVTSNCRLLIVISYFFLPQIV